MGSPLYPTSVTVNGERVEREVEPRLLLSDFLRHELGLTGTHVGCEHGVCGACTVLFDGQPLRSCLILAVQADGHDILTVEGLAKSEAELHPLQQAFWEAHGLQCGFCTPGILMTLVPFLAENHDPTDREIREAISGNLCRCTGYQHIVDAVKLAAEMAHEASDKEERILTKHPERGKKGVNITKEKYDIVRESILESLGTHGEMAFKDLVDSVTRTLEGKFEGSIPWYVTTVKLDLEARAVIERIPKTSPQRLRLVEK